MTKEAAVRFFDNDETIVGSGVRIRTGEILTTVSVIEDAAGRHYQRATHVDKTFKFDFPLSDNRDRFDAKVVRWPKGARSKPEDAIVTLQAASDLKLPSTLLDATSLAEIGTIATSVVYPFGVPEGIPVEGVLQGRQTRPQISLPRHENMAGAPLWSERGELVGLLLGRAPGGWDRHVALNADLADHRLGVGLAAATPGLRFNYAVSSAPRALMSDLLKLEKEGLDWEQCLAVQDTLESIAKELAEVDSNLPLRNRPSHAARDLHQTYVTWNNGDPGATGAPHRKHHLVLVKENAHRLQTLRRAYDAPLYVALDAGAQAIMGKFGELPLITDETGQTRFPEVRKVMARYRSRR